MKILSLNVNEFKDGLNSCKECIIEYLDKKGVDMVVLQEVKYETAISQLSPEYSDFKNSLAKKFELFEPKEPVNRKYVVSFKTLIITKKDLKQKLQIKRKDSVFSKWARFIEIGFILDGKNFSVLAVHVPLIYGREESKRNLQDYAFKLKDSYSIILGDFNAATDNDRSKMCNKKPIIENRETLEIMLNFNYHDVWREKNGNSKVFTWFYKSDKEDGRRLDYAFVSEAISNEFSCDVIYDDSVNTAIDKLNGISDHSILIIEVK
jgi:exonuclease III